MAVSAEDRGRWERQVAALRLAETQARPSPQTLARLVAEANAWRAAHGIEPLRGEFDDVPEERFYERARRLGFLGGSR